MRRRPNFEYIWGLVKPAAMKHASMSVGHHEAEDIVAEFSVKVWRDCTSGDRNFNDHAHAQAYYLRIFKFRVIDYIRSRQRQTALKLQVLQMHEHLEADGYNRSQQQLYFRDILSVAGQLDPVNRTILTGMVEGRNYTEIGEGLGVSKATVCRMVSSLMKQMTELIRVESECDRTGKLTKAKESTMAVKKKDKKVDDGPSLKALVAAAKDMNKKMGLNPKIKVAAGATVETLTAELKENGVEVLAEDTLQDGTWEVLQALDVGPKAGSKAKAPTTTPKAKEDTKESAPAPKEKPATKPKPAEKTKMASKPAAKPAAKKTLNKDLGQQVDLAKLRDFPKTLAAWRKKCGGPGHCLDGCGAGVSRTFKPGHDARLKSSLKKSGSVNAKAIAKELGWDQVIKW